MLLMSLAELHNCITACDTDRQQFLIADTVFKCTLQKTRNVLNILVRSISQPLAFIVSHIHVPTNVYKSYMYNVYIIVLPNFTYTHTFQFGISMLVGTCTWNKKTIHSTYIRNNL